MKVKFPSEAKLMAVAGTLRGMLLLRRICYWHAKTKIRRGGLLWITKTREEWGEDSGLTFTQVRRALIDLRARGVIATEQHLFYRKDGERITPNHLRLTDDAVAALEVTQRCAPRGDPQVGHLWRPGSGSHGDPEVGHSIRSAIYKGGIKGDTASEAEADVGKSVDEIVEDHEEARAERFTPEALEKMTSGPATIANLQEIWRCAHVLYRPEKGGTFTTKEKAWLKGIKDIDDLPALLAVIVREWPNFTDYAKDALGWKKVPARPQVLFIQQHASIADDWFTGYVAQALAYPTPRVSETSQGW